MTVLIKKLYIFTSCTRLRVVVSHSKKNRSFVKQPVASVAAHESTFYSPNSRTSPAQPQNISHTTVATISTVRCYATRLRLFISGVWQYSCRRTRKFYYSPMRVYRCYADLIEDTNPHCSVATILTAPM